MPKHINMNINNGKKIRSSKLKGNPRSPLLADIQLNVDDWFRTVHLYKKISIFLKKYKLIKKFSAHKLGKNACILRNI